MIAYVVILEDNAERLSRMRTCLAELLPLHQHIVFDNAYSMVDWLTDHLYQASLISLDHDLPIDGDHGTGREVADYLRGFMPTCPVVVHTSNGVAGQAMMQVLKDADWPVYRVYPHDDHNWVQRGWANQIRQLISSGWICS